VVSKVNFQFFVFNFLNNAFGVYTLRNSNFIFSTFFCLHNAKVCPKENCYYQVCITWWAWLKIWCNISYEWMLNKKCFEYASHQSIINCYYSFYCTKKRENANEVLQLPSLVDAKESSNLCGFEGHNSFVVMLDYVKAWHPLLLPLLLWRVPIWFIMCNKFQWIRFWAN
jgi:hypothetical protein